MKPSKALIERVARAILEARYKQYEETIGYMEFDAERYAKAAIAAMRRK